MEQLKLFTVDFVIISMVFWMHNVRFPIHDIWYEENQGVKAYTVVLNEISEIKTTRPQTDELNNPGNNK